MAVPRPDLLREIASLHKRVEELEATLLVLRGEDRPLDHIAIRNGLGLPTWLLQPFHLLLTRDFVSRETLDACAQSENAYRFHTLAINRLRRALAPYGVPIHNIYGEGFFISPVHRRQLKEMFTNES